jgi:hypothetical protein
MEPTEVNANRFARLPAGQMSLDGSGTISSAWGPAGTEIHRRLAQAEVATIGSEEEQSEEEQILEGRARCLTRS